MVDQKPHDISNDKRVSGNEWSRHFIKDILATMDNYVDTIGIGIFINAIYDGLKMIGSNVFLNNDKNQKENIADAIVAIQLATLESRDFIGEVGYQKNTDLVKLWQDAFKKAVKANIHKQLQDDLFHKAEFWGKPSDWINNPESLVLVPRLNYLSEECRMLLLELQN